jgi:hypothetical protein
MNRGPRDESLLSKISTDNPFKNLAPAFLGIRDGFLKDKEAARLDRDLSPKRVQDHLRKALSARQDRLKPLRGYNAETKAMEARVRLPDLDKSSYAARLRRETRDKSYYNMTPGERMGLLTGPGRDPDYFDAVREQKPWHSGFREKGELDVLAMAETERLAELHAPLQAAIAARKSNSDEILMIANTLLNDLAEDCGLKPREFEAEVKAFESKAAAEAPKATPEDRKSPAPEIEARYLAEMQEIDARFNRRVDEILSGSAA